MEAINFMYYTCNFTRESLEELLKRTTCYEHLKTKFKSLRNKYDGSATKAFYEWFMLLDNENKLIVANYIRDNYNYKEI